MIDSILEPNEFEGRVCIVTGATRGIGAAIAHQLAGRGGHIVVTDIDLEGAEARAHVLRDAGWLATARYCDVSDPIAVNGLFDDVAEIGLPRVLVNNAGIATISSTIELGDADWRRQVDIMLTGTFLCTRAAARSMLAAEGGAIVNLSSRGGFAGHPGRSAYTPPKQGSPASHKYIGVEWAAHGVRVNAVGPAVTRSLPKPPDT